MAITMARVARDHHPNIGILTNGPITGVGDRQFEATDAIVSAVDVDVIGVNYYPHTARTAASLRRLIEGEEVDAQRAGPIILSVHEHGGVESVQ